MSVFLVQKFNQILGFAEHVSEVTSICIFFFISTASKISLSVQVTLEMVRSKFELLPQIQKGSSEGTAALRLA